MGSIIAKPYRGKGGRGGRKEEVRGVEEIMAELVMGTPWDTRKVDELEVKEKMRGHPKLTVYNQF